MSSALSRHSKVSGRVLTAPMFRPMTTAPKSSAMLFVSYWLWDAQAKQVMLSFVVPRGICVLAGA